MDKHSNSAKVDDDAEGPQGTMIFSADKVNEMLAQENATVITGNEAYPLLTGVSDPFNGVKFELNKRKLIVGRKPDCDINLNESSVSATHAELVNDAGQWKVVNLLSSNGTFINGKKIAVESLKHGDKVSFGRAEFVFKAASSDDNTSTSDKPSETKEGNLLVPIAIGATLVSVAIVAVLYTIYG